MQAYTSRRISGVTASVTVDMQLKSYLVKSRHGIYYLRVQRNGVDKRLSLRTRDPVKAKLSAYKFGVFMSNNDFNFDGLRFNKLIIKTDAFEIKTDGSKTDNEAGLIALAALLNADMATLTATTNTRQIQASNKTISLRHAIDEYIPALENMKYSIKSRRMAISTLEHLAKMLEADFDMSLMNDEVIEDIWIPTRLEEVADTTVKRDLSFIKQFISWASDRKKAYCPAPLNLTFKADASNHYDCFDANDLKLIFDNLPQHAELAWQFWIPIIGLYSGARISEPSAMTVDNIFTNFGIDMMHLPGTKTDTSPRDIPIHPDLINLGLIKYANQRKKDGHAMLFDLKKSDPNGYGAAPSKWFTALKKTVGINNKKKVFHSFRHTISDHLKQAGASFDANCQFTGHSSGGSVKNKVYTRNLLNNTSFKIETTDKIDWQKHCGWSPNLDELKAKAVSLL